MTCLAREPRWIEPRSVCPASKPQGQGVRRLRRSELREGIMTGAVLELFDNNIYILYNQIASGRNSASSRVIIRFRPV